MKDIRREGNLIGPMMLGASERTEEMFCHFCRLLSEIAQMVSTEKDLTIDDMLSDVNSLPDEDEDVDIARQALFTGLGLVTLFFEPELQPLQGVFQLRIDQPHRMSRNHTWRASQSDLDQATTTISSLLRSFSGTYGWIPSYGISQRMNAIDNISGSNVCFYTLTRLAGIEILWVDNICSHLEFDWNRQLLKLYRFPSFCALIAVGNEDSNYLSWSVQHTATPGFN